MIYSLRCEDVTYKSRTRGALLSLPNGGRREEVIRTKVFEDYTRDHVVSWFNWAQKNKLGVERMEDLILVSARTLVNSWAAAAFVDNTLEAEITLASRTLSNGSANFVWSKIQGPVVYHNSRQDPVRSSALVFLTCANFSYVIWKAKSTCDSGSMRLHQRFPSKARLLLWQTNPSCSGTPSRRPRQQQR